MNHCTSLTAEVLERARESPPIPWPVIEACGMPEIGTCVSGLSIHIDPGLRRPFVLDGAHVIIQHDYAATVTGSALILREAIELNILGKGQPEWADRILAHATALAFGATTLVNLDEQAAYDAFSPVADVADEILTLHDLGDRVNLSALIARRIAEFLEIRDQMPISCPSSEITRAARALFLAVPTEVLLTSGASDRQMVDWRTGVNTYGVSPSPRPWAASFGSCTASSTTPRAFAAAARLRQQLIKASLAEDLGLLASEHSAVMRKTLLTALGLEDGPSVEVVFTPSGTDAELVPLLVALGAGEPVHSIIVGQNEIGTGSADAAVGRHFGERLPSGRIAQTGDALNGLDSNRVTKSVVVLRDARGHTRTAAEVEDDMEKIISDNFRNRRILVHFLEGSKTGIRLPRQEALARWRQTYACRIDVIVDAAQMRVDHRTIVDHARSGSMVLVTGSKFFGGPPFSGAVLIPSALAPRLNAGRVLPDGVSDYLSKTEVPPTLSDLHAVARPGMNVGLLLRWEAALVEMRLYHNISPEIRQEVFRALAAGLRRMLEQTSCVSIVMGPYTFTPKHNQHDPNDLPTIFTFVTHGPDGEPLTTDQCEVVHRRLAQDIYSVLKVEEAVLRRTFHLGRPVKVYQRNGKWIGGLRLAIGAPTVSDIVFDHTKARTWTERIDRTLADVSEALRKLELIVRYLRLDDDDQTPMAARLRRSPEATG